MRLPFTGTAPCHNVCMCVWVRTWWPERGRSLERGPSNSRENWVAIANRRGRNLAAARAPSSQLYGSRLDDRPHQRQDAGSCGGGEALHILCSPSEVEDGYGRGQILQKSGRRPLRVCPWTMRLWCWLSLRLRLFRRFSTCCFTLFHRCPSRSYHLQRTVDIPENVDKCAEP